MALDSNNIQINFDATINEIDVAPGAFNSARKELTDELGKLVDSDRIFDDFYKGLPKLESVGKAAFKELGASLGSAFDIDKNIKAITDKIMSVKQQVSKDTFKMLDADDLTSLENALREGAKEGQALAGYFDGLNQSFTSLLNKAFELSGAFNDVDSSIRLNNIEVFDRLDAQLSNTLTSILGLKEGFASLRVDNITDLSRDISRLLDTLNTLDAVFKEITSDSVTSSSREKQLIYEQKTRYAIAKESAKEAKKAEDADRATTNVLNTYLDTLKRLADASDADKFKGYVDAYKELGKAGQEVLKADLSEGIEELNKAANSKDLEEASKKWDDFANSIQRTMIEARSKQIFDPNTSAPIEKAKKSTDSLKSSLDRIQSSIKSGFNFQKVVVGFRLIERIGRAAVRVFRTLVNVIKNFIQLNIKMASSISKAFANVISSVTKAAVKISGLQAVLTGLKNVAEGIGKSIQGIVGQVSFTDLMKQSSNLASALVEVQNRVDVVFGKSADIINNLASTAIEKLGMTTLATKQFAAGFGAALSAAGQSTENINSMSVALTKLTADMASFYDISQDLAYQKLFSGVISGQVKAMRSLGVDMTVNSLSAYALAKGYQTAYREMDAATKAAIRYQYVMEKLGYVHGDFERTINSTANQVRLLKNQLSELGTIVGAIINTFLNPLIQVLNRLLSSILAVAKTIASVMGIDWSAGIGAGGGAVSDLADDYDDLSDSVGDAEDSINGAAKAAKKALAPFHQLNVLQNKDTSGSNKSKNIGGGGVADFNVPEVKAEALNLKKAIKDLFDWLWGLDWEGWARKAIKAINNFFDDLPAKIRAAFTKAQKWIKRIVELFNQFVRGINWQNIGRTLNAAIWGIGESILTAFKTIDVSAIAGAVSDFINGLFEDPAAFMVWGQSVGKAINNAFQFIKETAAGIDWSTIGKDIYIFIRNSFAEINPNDIYGAIVNSLGGITTALAGFFDRINKDEATKKKIASTITAFINAAADYIASPDFANLLDSIVDFILDELGQIETKLEEGNAKDDIVKGITTIISAGIRLVTSDEFIAAFDGLWSTFADAFDNLYKALDDAGIIDKIKDAVVSRIKTAFDWVKKEIVTLLGGNEGDSVWGTIKSKLHDKLVEAFDANGDGDISEEIRKKVYDVISKLFNIIKEEVINFFTSNDIPVELKLLAAIPAIADIMGKIAGVLSFISQIKDFIMPLIELIGGEGGLTGVLGGLSGVFTTVGNAITGFIGALSAPVVAIAAAIAAIIAAFADLYTNVDRFREEINNIFGSIKDTVGAAFSNISDAITRLKENFSSTFATWSPVIEQIKNMFLGLWEALKGIWNFVTTLLEPVFVGLFATLSSLINGAIEVISGAIQMVIGLIDGFLNGDWTTFINGLETTFSGLMDILLAAWTGMCESFQYLLENFGEWFNNLWEGLKQFVLGIFDAIVSEFGAIVTALIGKWTNFKDDSVRKVTEAIDAIKDLFKKLVDWFEDNIINKISDAWNNLKSKFTKTDVNINSSGGVSFRNTPAGASGMIIHPNKPQVAIVGDQRSGINVESPLSTIVEAFEKVAGNQGFNGNITIPVYVDGQLTSTKVITAEQLYNYRSNGR